MILTQIILGLKAFTVYQYLSNKQIKNSSGTFSLSPSQIRLFYKGFGLVKFCLAYHSALLNCSSRCDQYSIPDEQKLRRTKTRFQQQKCERAMLDVQVYDKFRFRPYYLIPGTNRSILSSLVQIINSWKLLTNISTAFYSQVPQNVFSKAFGYDQLMLKYKPLANKVDYFSPGHYNYFYNGTSAADQQWKQALLYSMTWARILGKNKPFIPLIQPTYALDNLSFSLSYQQMIFRLKTLRQLGAEGCIIWESSSLQYLSGSKQIFASDSQRGWFKAVIDFIKDQN